MVLNNLGVISHAKGQVEQAERYFRRALEADGRYLEAMANLAALHRAAKRWQDAAECLEKYVAADDTDVGVLNQLGVVYMEMGRPARAAPVLRRSLEVNPRQDAVRQTLEKLEASAPSRPAGEEPTEATRTAPAGQEGASRRPPARRLNVLFVQQAPCIRNYKMATALRARGHRVSLAYTQGRLSQMYPGLSDETYDEVIHLADFKHLWDISGRYDLVHCHNEPDILTVAALAGSTPVVHDTHDLISLRGGGDETLRFFEGIANRGAHGRVYSTPQQLEEARRLYGGSGRSLVFHNYASAADLPKRRLAKLSQTDGKVHVVYEGGIGTTAHRDFCRLFRRLAEKGICIHIYPTAYDERVAQLFAGLDNIDYRQPTSPRQIMEQMTQYDFGIIPFNLDKGNKRFLDSTIANKLFEYLVAGLPVCTSPLATYKEFFRTHPVGVTFEDADDLVRQIPKLRRIAAETDFSRFVFTYEQEIPRLERFYQAVLESASNASPAAAAGAPPARDDAQDDRSRIQAAVDRLLAWLDANGWDGYDPYDVQDWLIQQARAGKAPSRKRQRELLARNERDPMGVRAELGIATKRIPKGLGLLAAARVRLYKATADPSHLEEAARIADWLLDNPSRGYGNLCWGYPFDWQSVIFIPKDTPSAVVSTAAGDGLWELYTVTRDAKYLDACVSICRFLTENLRCGDMGEKGICFSYTPIDDYHVHNANLFAGEFLARIGREIDDEAWRKLGERTADYAISEQNDDGSIFYWGRVQNDYAPRKLDHYHSGFEIRCLWRLWQHLGLDKLRRAWKRYLSFYLKSFRLPDGTPKIRPDAPYPVNIHGAAECVLMLSMLSREAPELLDEAGRSLLWTIDRMQTDDGSFAYTWGPDGRIDAPYLRWGQAWMLRAMAEYLTAVKVRDGEWGYYSRFGPAAGRKAAADGSAPPGAVRKAAPEAARVEDAPAPRRPEVEAPARAAGASARTDYQILMPKTGDLAYGSKEWAEALFHGAEADPWGHDWRASQKARYVATLELIDRHVSPGDVSRVLDIGCALGHFTMELKDRFPAAEILGVDISDEAIRKCRRMYSGMAFAAAKLPELAIDAGGFDFVAALEVLSYVGAEHVLPSLERIRQLTAPGGVVAISSFVNRGIFASPAELTKAVSKYFRVVEQVPRYHALYNGFETDVRMTMQMVRDLTTIPRPAVRAAVEGYLRSAFELLGSVELVDLLNEHARRTMGEKGISHLILLAVKEE
jgi:SAM-dependent methyltransferase